MWRKARRFLGRVVVRFVEDDGTVFAGHIAYSLMLAALPFLIFAVALAGFVVGEQGAEMAVGALFEGLPKHVAKTLEPVLLDALGRRRGGVLTLSALATLWAASNGVEAVRLGLERAYGVPRSRHVALSRLIALGVVIGGMVMFILVSVLIVFAPLAFTLVERWTGISVPAEADLIRYGLGLAVLWPGLWVMHRVLPSRPMGSLVLWPGVLASVVIWSLAATAFSFYLAWAPFYSVTYGALAGVMVTLVFFYLTGVALIFGAEVNAELNGLRETGGEDSGTEAACGGGRHATKRPAGRPDRTD